MFLSRLTIASTIVSATITYDWFCRGEFTFCAVGLVCILILAKCHNLFGRNFPLVSAWLAVWFTSHLLGMYFGLYETSSIFDKAMHAVITSGFVMLWIDWTQPAVARSWPQPSRQLTGTIVLALIFTLSTAALWEIFEFTIDLTGFFTAQRSLEDTMLDMIAALAGGLLALIHQMVLAGQTPSETLLVNLDRR